MELETTATKSSKPRRQKRSGTIRQLASGLWQSIARPKGQPTQSKTFFNKEDGERWLREIYSAVDKGAFVSTVSACSGRIYPHHERRAWGLFRTDCRPMGADSFLCKGTEAHIQHK